MSKKYELLTDDTVPGRVSSLYRIRALRDIPEIGVSMSDLGGYIQSENNLSHNGDAWVQEDARVDDKARVFGNAQVRDTALVDGNAQVYDDALVCGNAFLSENSCVYGAALVCEDAWVLGGAQVYGNAQVRDKARVDGNARVYGNARVRGTAWVYRSARIANLRHMLSLGPIGSEDGTFTLFRTDSGPCVTRGGFSGTLDEFEKAVNETHGDNQHAQEYRAVIALARLRVREWEAQS